jgi:hypothetical protein
METIHTIETPELTAKFNKQEIDIAHFIESWLPTFMTWGVDELAIKTRVSDAEANAAVDMLILHGLLEMNGLTHTRARSVAVTDAGAKWLRENSETINSLQLMLDTSQFEDDETAIA